MKFVNPNADLTKISSPSWNKLGMGVRGNMKNDYDIRTISPQMTHIYLDGEIIATAKQLTMSTRQSLICGSDFTNLSTLTLINCLSARSQAGQLVKAV